ncbi:MAG: hypothetical protein ACT4QF_23670 [Sporichthyaceae bacterium]
MSPTNLLRRLLGRDGRAESDVRGDDSRVDARHVGGDPDRIAQEGTTTGTGSGGHFVGRVAGDDDFAGEDGADRRAAHTNARS